jgi:hypothetical protein
MDILYKYKNEKTLFYKLLEKELSHEQIIYVGQVIDHVCNECWDEEDPCFCNRDE